MSNFDFKIDFKIDVERHFQHHLFQYRFKTNIKCLFYLMLSPFSCSSKSMSLKNCWLDNHVISRTSIYFFSKNKHLLSAKKKLRTKTKTQIDTKKLFKHTIIKKLIIVVILHHINYFIPSLEVALVARTMSYNRILCLSSWKHLILVSKSKQYCKECLRGGSRGRWNWCQSVEICMNWNEQIQHRRNIKWWCNILI